MSLPAPNLSLILACYNEEPHLADNVREIRRTLGACRWESELIFIDDASSDRTPAIISEVANGDERATVRFHEANVGRGGTVAEGMRIARGQVVGFIDVDLEVHCRYIPAMVQAILEDGYDVATAHRVYKFRPTPSAFVRWVLSSGYRKLVQIALISPFEDTETGFKFFRRERLLPVLDRCRDKHWFWDTEVMLESQRAGLKVIEIPALFQRQSSSSSSLRVFADTVYYLRALRRYRVRLKRPPGKDRDG
jgi:glycosyltransferase involved in cell wall biosynthesis